MNSTNIPNLPTEIHEHIIDCLAMDQAEHYPIDIALDLPRIKRSTLATCATTCRNWLPRARMHIFQTVSLRQASHLTLLKDSPGIWSHIRTLEVHENIDIQPYAHLVSYYFATKLPSLTGLQFDNRTGSSGIFVPHNSFLMQLSQFQNVQTLELASYKFPSFLAIRRFVGALPRLSTVILTDISWGEDVPRTTSLIHSNWALRIVKLWGCQSPFLGHWFWIIPPPKTSKRSYRELERPGSHPGISAMDAQAISDIIQILANGNGEGNSDSRELRWEDTTSTKLPAWIFKFTCANHESSSTFTLCPDAMKLPSATSLASLILIDSASFVLEPWRLSLKDFKWENLDSSLSQLEDLTKVEVVLPSTCTAEDEQYVVSQLPISQRREILHVKCKPKSGGPSGKN